MAVGDLDDRLPHRSGGLDGDRLCVKASLLRDANAVPGDALAEVGGGAIAFDEAERAVGRAGGCGVAQCGRRLPDGHDQRIATAQQAPSVLDRVLGILGALVAQHQRTVGGASVPGGVDCEGADRQAEAVLDVLDEPALLSVGVL